MEREREREREREEEDRRKMEDYLAKKQGRGREDRRDRREDRRGDRNPIPDDIDLDKLDPETREKIINELGLKNRRDRDRDKGRRNPPFGRDRDRDRRERRQDRRELDREMKRKRDEEIEKQINRDNLIVSDEGDNKLEKEEIKQEDEVEVEGRVNEEEEGEEEEEDLTNWDKIWISIADIDISGSEIESESDDILNEKSYRIKSSFLHAWHGYAKHALGHDEIHPVSDLPGDSWGGLGATLIDALDTMMIMGIKDEFKIARGKLQDVNFNIDLQVSFFETTIRHLGGLIGAYEMSKLLKPKDDFILSQAISLADQLLPAFLTPSGIPKSMVNLQNGEIKNYGWTKDRSVLSEVGSNQLEFYAMSEYTNNEKYYIKSSNVFKLLNIAQIKNGINGLYSRLIETDTATFPKNEKVYSLGGMSDSFYEYTLKLWILTNYNDKLAIKMYIESINAANEKLLRMIYDKNRRETPYFFYGEQWYTKFRGKMEELQCFMPGVLALGSYHAILRSEDAKKNPTTRPLSEYEKLLISESDKHLKLAHVLLESCVALYAEMPTGLAPESIEFNDNSWNPKEMKYQLRPETVESLFIMYSLTGNQQYRNWGWNIFESIEKHCKTDIAFSGIQDVTEIPAKQDNQMQSYVMAETFKYLYLLFDDYAASLLPLNQYVFNTEAHPIKIINDIDEYDWYKPQIFSNDDNQQFVDDENNNNNNNDQIVEGEYNDFNEDEY